MAYRFAPPHLILGSIVLLVLTACGAGSDEGTESVPVELVVESAGISLDGDAVPVGEPTAVPLGQSIVVDESGLGQVSAGDVDFKLFTGADLQFQDSDRLGSTVSLELGHLEIRTAQETETRLTLNSPNAIITNLTKSFEATACQGPDGTSCLRVGSGQFAWQSAGESVIVRAGESVFALPGEPSGPKRCVSDDDYAAWFDAAQRNTAPFDLAGLVAVAPQCDADGEDGFDQVAADEDDGQAAEGDEPSSATDGSTTDDDGPSGATDGDTTDGGTDTASLQAQVDEVLANIGLPGLVGTVDGDTVTVTGEVSSEGEAAAVEAALAGLLVVVDNQIVVVEQSEVATDDSADPSDDSGETPAAEAADSDPDFTG